MIYTGTKNIIPHNHYRFDETSGSTAYDTGQRIDDSGSEGDSDGTIVGGVTLNTVGNRGKCFNFNGSTGYVDLGDIFNPLYNEEMSFFFRIKTGATAATSVIIKKFGSGQGYTISFDSSGTLTFSLLSTAVTNELNVTANLGLNDTVWHDVGITYDGSTNASGVTIYFNGVSVSTTTVYDTLSATIANSSEVNIGSDSGSTNFFGGLLQDVRLFKEELTSDEIKHITNYGFYQNIYTDSNKKLILWNKLGSTEEVESSLVGVDGAENTGSETYADCKFGKGLSVPNYTDTEDVHFDIAIDKGKMTIDLWWKANMAHTGAGGQAPFMWEYVPPAGRATAGNVIVLFRGNDGDWDLINYRTTGGTITHSYDDTFAVNDIKHYRIIISEDAEPSIGNDRCAFYIDGVRATRKNGTAGIDESETTEIASTGRLTIGNVDASFGAGRGGRGIFDNVKIWNYANVDFSDTEIEYPLKVNGTNISTNPLKQLLLWNTLSSTENTQDSMIGINGEEISSPSYASGKFGNGLSVPTYNITDAVRFGAMELPDTITIDFWYKPDVDSSAITFPTFIHFYPVVGGTTTSGDIRIIYTVPNQQWYMLIYNGSTNTFLYDDTFTAGDEINIRAIFSTTTQDAIGGDRTALFINGTRMTLSVLSTGDETTTIPNMGVSLRMYVGNLGFTTGRGMEGVIDNIKLWNYANVDFSGIEVQEPIDIQGVVTQ